MTARTATIYSGLELPDGTRWAGQVVTATLNLPTAFTIDGLTEIGRSCVAANTPTGFEMSLIVNDDIDPAGTTWSVKVADLPPWTVQLHAAHADQRVPLRSVLVTAPTNPNPVIFTTATLVGNIDGGSASSIYTPDLMIDGGGAAA